MVSKHMCLFSLPITTSYVGLCKKKTHKLNYTPLSCWTRIYPAFANSVDPDQLASEANWSESALFAIKYLYLYQHPGSSNLLGWKLEVGVAA